MILGQVDCYIDFVKELNAISETTWDKRFAANAWSGVCFMSRWQNHKAGADEPFNEIRTNLDGTCSLYGVKVAIRQHQAIFQSDRGGFTVTI